MLSLPTGSTKKIALMHMAINLFVDFIEVQMADIRLCSGPSADCLERLQMAVHRHPFFLPIWRNKQAPIPQS